MAERRLILDSVPDDFDPEQDLVLSPYSFVNREHVWPDWHKQEYFDPFRTGETRWRDWMRTRIHANRLCRALARDMNERHGKTYGDGYWRELSILWLLLLIQSAWLRYVQINAAIDRWSDLPLNVPIAGNAGPWEFRDDLDFYHNGPRNHDYDLWVCTLIMRDRAPQNWNLYPLRDVSYRPQSRPAQNATRGRAAPALLRRRRIYNITGAGRVAETILSCMVPFFPRRPPSAAPTVDETSDPDETAPFPADFQRLLDILLAETMPRTLSDDFSHHDGIAAALPYRRGKLFVSGASKYVAKNRFMTAHAIENGERVIRYQHGSSYGAAQIMIGHEMEYYDHGFISWGWTDDGAVAKPAIPLPAPTLSRIAGRHRAEADDIILIGTNTELGPYPFKPSPQAGQFIEYRRRKAQLINGLAPDARQRLWYRPYVNTESDLTDADFVATETGPLRLLTGNLSRKMLSAGMVVVDHPGTPMYQSLAANVPTLLTWERDAWPMHEYGSAEIDILEKAGLYFDDVDEAAAKINAISGDIAGWWQSDTVQSAKNRWCEKNALTSRFWWKDWIETLARLP